MIASFEQSQKTAFAAEPLEALFMAPERDEVGRVGKNKVFVSRQWNVFQTA